MDKDKQLQNAKPGGRPQTKVGIKLKKINHVFDDNKSETGGSGEVYNSE